MSIQQSMNQMLALTATGVGLYAHSPEGQRQAEIKKLEKDYQKTEAHRKEWDEPVKDSEVSLAELNTKLQRERSQRLYELDPSTKRAEQLTLDLESDPNWVDYGLKGEPSPEAKALQSISQKIGSIDNRLKGFEARKAILKKSRKKGGR